jgi:hypothetical protein
MKVARVAAALAFASSAAAAEPLRVVHTPPPCIATDRYAVIEAAGEPVDAVAGAELQFRADPASGWYATDMRAAGGAWTALLPRASREVPGFQYRVVLRDRDLQEVSSEIHAVPVAGIDCGARSRTSVEAPVVVRVPPGAPVAPPVPAGFSPAGVAPIEEEAGPAGRKKFLLGAVAVVGGAAAFAATREANLAGPGPIEPPDLYYGGTVPTARLMSVGGNPLQVFVFQTFPLRGPFEMAWRFEVLASGITQPCLHMSGFVPNMTTQWVLVSSPYAVSGACPASFTSSGVRLVVEADGIVRYDFTHVLNPPFSFEP